MPSYVEYMGKVNYVNKSVPSFVNVSVLEYDVAADFALVDAYYNDSVDPATGSYFINITGDMMSMYLLRIYSYSDASYDSVEQMSPSNLPHFPAFMFMQPMDPMEPSLYNQTINVVPATTLNFSAFKYVPSDYCGGMDYCIPDCAIQVSSQWYNCSNVSFNYMVSDTKRGMEIASQWGSVLPEAEVIVTPDRNYTLELMPNGPPINVPVNLESSDAGSIKNYYINTTFDMQNITGKILLNGETPLLTSSTRDVKVISFARVPGNDYKMVPKDATIPANIMVNPGPGVDIWDSYDNDTGDFILGLPGTGYGGKFLLTAWVNSTDGAYVGVQNITVFYEGPPMSTGTTQVDVNISVYPTALARVDTQAHTSDFRLFDFSSGGDGGKDALTSVTAAYNTIMVYGQNQSNQDQLIPVDSAHVELEVGYNLSGEEYPIYWMMDLDSSSQGRIKWAFPENAYYAKLKVFSQQYAPKSKVLDISAAVQNVSLSSFEMKDEKGAQMNMSDIGFSIAMMQQGTVTTPAGDVDCDALYPSNVSACYIGDPFTGSFNPIQALMAGVTNIRMLLNSGVQLRLMGVDLIASGPPDAVMDANPETSQQGDAMAEAWKFGSLAPADMYEYVFIGMPINTTRIDLSASVNVSIPILYDEDDNVVFNLSSGDDASTVGNLTEYRDYLPDYEEYFTDSGVECSLNNMSSHCFINASDSPPMAWMRIPHFSSVEPTVEGASASTTTTSTTTTTTTTTTTSSTSTTSTTTASSTTTTTAAPLSPSGGGGSGSKQDLYIEFDAEMAVGEETVVTVRIKDEDGSIVYRAEVEVYVGGEKVLDEKTDSQGKVRFTPVSEASVRIEAEKPGYDSATALSKSTLYASSPTTTVMTARQSTTTTAARATTTLRETTTSTIRTTTTLAGGGKSPVTGMMTASTTTRAPTTTVAVEKAGQATCSDGVRNHGETDIDCGGPCQACPESGSPLVKTGVVAVVLVIGVGALIAMVAASSRKKGGKGSLGRL